ncbi:DUF5818 domain-containing protein [Sandarakinorhabdus rubra]|uniref:DUF5818 domain-containing protein n=1 Tax=Sandarakinorhabdus rubra TaxID=2672568 RepID=UPI001F279330|nr:DUF5818 domain-containing protein [Sandarakinorhabdus rubra]
MPRGKRYELLGSLLKDNQPANLILQCDDGGVWRLDANTAAWRLVGQRVHVIGFRADFDILDVHSITPVSEQRSAL